MVSMRSMARSNFKPTPSNPDCNISQPTFCYIFCLICNVVLIMIYTVLVFSPHKECIVDGVNFTPSFNTAFIIGFSILVADFMNSSILVLLRKSATETPNNGLSLNGGQKVQIFRADWIIIILTLVVSVV